MPGKTALIFGISGIIGRALAEQDYERAKGNDNRSGVRKILNRPTE